MLRLIVSAAVGVAIGAVVVFFVGPPGAGVVMFSIALPVAIVARTLMSFARVGAGTASPDTVRAARDARRLGRARIDGLRQTGIQLNDQPLCDIDLTVRPLTGEAYATTLRMVVAVTEVPAHQPGVERDVVLLWDGGPEVAFADGDLSPAERAALVVPPRAAVPLRPIDPHTRVKNGRRRGPLIGIGRRGRGWRILLFTAVAIVAATATVLPYREAVQLTVAAWQDGRWHVDLRRPDALAQAERSLQAAIGHDRVVSVVVSDEFVIVEAPLSPGQTATDEWIYRGGQVERRGAASIQPDLPGEQFTWSQVRLDRAWDAVERAAAASGIAPAEASIVVGRDTDGDIDSPTFAQPVAAPVMRFGLDDDYRRVSVVLDADGAVISTS